MLCHIIWKICTKSNITLKRLGVGSASHPVHNAHDSPRSIEVLVSPYSRTLATPIFNIALLNWKLETA